MSLLLDAEAPSLDPVLSEEAAHVKVFRYSGITYLMDTNGAVALDCAERSRTLVEMPEARGTTTLPLTLSAVNLWRDAVTSMDSTGNLWMEWRTRVQDLCTLATVCWLQLLLCAAA